MWEAANLPNDIAELKSMLISATGEVRKDERIERLERLVAAFKKAAFGVNPKRVILSSSIWSWKIWKRP